MQNRNRALDRIRAGMREPLVHFLILGAGIFILFRVLAGPAETSDERIVVTAGRIDHLVTVFSKTRQRPPSDQELSGLIDNYVLEEVLYRQALALGLDKNDTIIRRRLRQKMEFLVDDFAASEAADSDLQRFLDENPEAFREEARVDFTQVQFKPTESEEAARVLAGLREGGKPDIDAVGDRSLLPSHFSAAAETEISGLFGEGFKDDLLAQEVGQWTGPITSPFGLHLVKIDRKVEGRIPELSQIREAVTRDWMYARRRTAQQTLFDQLRSQYTVIVEPYGGSGTLRALLP